MIDKDAYAVIVILLVFGALTVKLIVDMIRKRPKIIEEHQEEKVPAQLVKKEDGIVYNTGTNHPSHNIECKLHFLLEDGRKKTFSVEREIYDAVCEGQNGVLYFCEDFFLGFEY